MSNEYHRAQFKGYVEDSCVEVDRVTPVEKIFEGKDIYIYIYIRITWLFNTLRSQVRRVG